MHDTSPASFGPSALKRTVLIFGSIVLLASVLSVRLNASPDTYGGSAEYGSTSGYRGWTYWDSLGQQMVWDAANSRWTCLNPLTPQCYWTSTGGYPGIDRNVLRRWTPPGTGSARITGSIQKESSFCDEQSVAVGKPSTQSSVRWGGVPSRGNDGNTNGDFWAGSVMHTDYDVQPWYQIDLGALYFIHRIEVWNRSDGSFGESARTTNFNVMTSADGSNWTVVNVLGQAGLPTSLAWWNDGRYVKVQLVDTNQNYLNLAEVQVFSNANDGAFANIWHETAQSNHYLTYTTPGPPQRTAYSRYMDCSDSNAYPFDIDAEIYPDDKIEFEIDRNSNYNWDGTAFSPIIVFEPADAIGSPWATSTPTSVEVRFNGLLKCPNGASCGYTDTLPPDYYTVHRMGTITSGSVFLGQFPNWARCGPADGPLCFDIERPSHFSVLDSSGIAPNSWYKYKIRAYKGGLYPHGRLYGQTRTIQVTTGAITPPALTPTVSVTAPGFEYGSRDAVISWQAPAPPLDKHNALERFELYRQGLSSVTVSSGGVVKGNGTGEQLCAALPQSAFPGQWTCLSSTAPGGGCSVKFRYGSATCALWDPPVRVGYTTWDRNNSYQVWVNTADQGSPSRDTGAFGLVTSVTDPGVDRKPTTYRYYLVARYKATYASPAETSEVTANIVLPRAATLAGFADTHVHQFGNLAHGGTILDGRSGDTDDSSPTYNASRRNMDGFLSNSTGIALRGCDAVADGGTGAHDLGFWGNLLVDLLGAGHSKTGIKELPEWLLYSNAMHQQVYKTALKRAVDGGLRLMVMHSVNSEFLCKAVAAVRGNGRSPISCDDSTSLDLQITAAYRFQSEIDREAKCTVPDEGLPNTNLDNFCGWYRIVTTPAAARKAMKNGKLAVVLGIEAATPFACGTGSSGGMWAGGNSGNWNQGGTRPTCAVGGSAGGVVNILDPRDGNSLQYFYNRGVRHVFPVHGANNGLGSAALFNPSNLYAYNQAALNGTWFRPGACLNRGAGLDGPMAYRISPALRQSLGPFGAVDFGSVFLGPGMAVPAGFPGGSGATCNLGGNWGDTTPAVGLTSLGRSVLQEMMKRRMLIDVDHMSERAHVDAVAESRKSFNYPLVSGHANLQRISTGSGGDPGSEVSLSTPELNEVRASGGQVNLVAVASFETKDIAQYSRLGGHAAARQFLPRANSVGHDCDNSSKAWAQAYLAAVDLTRNAPMPDDNSAPGVDGVGFGSDFNTMMSMIQPRFGYKNGEWYGCSGLKASSENSQQLGQMVENAAGGIGKAVQYDIDMIDGSPTLKGHGGVSTSLNAEADLAFPGFSGPRLRRSRLNEGGYLFTLYGPDKSATSIGQYSSTTKCLDSWGWTKPGDWPRIDHCGNTREYNQQWFYSNQRIIPLRDRMTNLVLQRNLNNTYVLIDSRCTSNCEWAVTYDGVSSSPEGVWVTLASGQLYNPQSNRCLGVQNHGYGGGNFVVAAPCAGNSFGSPLQPDQMWARGGEEESFNLTGLHHIGMYPDLIQDLKNIGLTNKDLVPLFQSAEGYLQMWERTGWTKAIDYTKLSSDGTWKVTTASPAAGWQNIDFNDTRWRSVSDTYPTLASYGDAPWYTNVAGFPNPTPARWMPIAAGNYTQYFRKTFASDKTGTPKTVSVAGDNVVKVYLDGALKASSNNWQVLATFTFTPASFGSHVIAIEATNQGGPGGVLVDVR